MQALRALLKNRKNDLPDWVVGKIPSHYKRISVEPEEALRLARLGAMKIGAYFGDKLFFSQAVIAGACLSGDYDTIVVCTCSQYGKSWLFGRVAVIRAYEQHRDQFIAGGTGDKTMIIQNHAIKALQSVTPEVQNALSAGRGQLERLAQSVSKTKLAFSEGGSIESLTLGDTYNDLGANKAIGRGGDYFVDEAALVSEDAFAELGRRDFADVTGRRGMLCMISNPHRTGTFYDKLTDENPPRGTFILWMDALTAVEEERFDEDQVLHSDFARNRSTRRRYLMCELDTLDDAMFNTPKIYEGESGEYKQYFLGVDSAYKGKDNLVVTLASLDEDGMVRIEDIQPLKTNGWTQGKTSKDLIGKVYRIAKSFDCAYACIDIGWGVWLVEGLTGKIACQGVNFGSAPTKSRVRSKQYAATNAVNTRAEMHLDLQGLIDDEQIMFSKDSWDKVRDTFPFVTCDRRANGKIEVVPKSKIKRSIGRSPDELDSVLLAIHAIMLFLGGVPMWLGKKDE